MQAKSNRANALSPIPDAATFVRDVESATATTVTPTIVGVVTTALLSDDGSGFAVIYVPKGYTAHQCITNTDATNYWLRGGDSVKPLPHSLMSALIMARAKPDLRLVFGEPKSTFRSPSCGILLVGLCVKNVGEVMAHNVALCVFTNPQRNLEPINGLTPILFESGGSVVTASQRSLPSTEVLYPGQMREFIAIEFREGALKSALPEQLLVAWLYADGFASQVEHVIDPEYLKSYVPKNW